MTEPSANSGALPPAGWYADPANSARQRWWSGLSWTDQVRHDPAQPVAAAPPASEAAPVESPVARPEPSGWSLRPDPAPSISGSFRPAATRSHAETVEADLASFWRRTVATLIDNFVVSLVSLAALSVAVQDFQSRLVGGMQSWYTALETNRGALPSDDITHLVTVLNYTLLATSFVYGAIFLSLWSRTPGQRLAGIALAPPERPQEGIDWRRAIPRSLTWSLLSLGGGFLLIPYVMSLSMVLWHPRRQTIPDLLARTLVVRRRS